MGEAKRRQENDPNYGKVKQKRLPKSSKSKWSIQNVSKSEMIIWAVIFGAAAATFAWTYLPQ